MRVALYSLTALLLIGAVGLGQDTKKKKDAKPADGGSTKLPDIKEVAGKSFEQWLAEIHSTDPSKRENAMRSILGFGPYKAQGAVPAILKELKKHNRPVPVDLAVRISGAAALGTILSSVREPSTPQVKEAVTILKGFAKDEQVLVRTRAVEALGQLAFASHDVQDATEDVIRAAGDLQTWQARQAGLAALVRLSVARMAIDKKTPSPRVLATFEKALKDNSMMVRITAVQSLSQLPIINFGDDVRRIRSLETLLAKDPEASVRIWCDLALMTIKKNLDAAHLGGIIRMLHYKADPAVRIQAANSLGMLGQQPPFGSKDLKTKERALNGKELALVVRELATGLSDPDIHVVSACIGALFMIEPNGAVGPIANILNHEQPVRRAQAAQALGMLGDKAKPAENLLIVKLTTEKNLEVVAHVITALVHMASVNAVPALEKLAAAPPEGKGGEFIQQAAKDAARVIMEVRAREEKEKNAPRKAPK